MIGFEVVVGSSVTFLVSGTGSLTDGLLYLDGVASGITPTISQVGVTNAWKITFTPASTGIYSFYAFNSIQVQFQSVVKSIYTMLTNIEDESLGSWSWDKDTGVLSMLRQNGTVMATFNVIDTLPLASRERVS